MVVFIYVFIPIYCLIFDICPWHFAQLLFIFFNGHFLSFLQESLQFGMGGLIVVAAEGYGLRIVHRLFFF